MMSGKDERRPLREDERALWDVFTKPIKPLKRPPPKPAKADATAAPVAAAKVRKKAAPSVPPAPAPKPPAPPPLAPLSRREKAKVARGRIEIDARLDLHGMTQEEAHSALLRFLRQASAREARLVLVITGKSGVLRRETPRWLALPDFRALVISAEPAAIRHGGDGALYVRVRRTRA